MIFRYLASRGLQAIFVLLGVSFAVFMLAHLSGDPASLMVDATATPAEVQTLRHSMGLDRPLGMQYLTFLERAVRGDLGTSLWQQQPALSLVLGRFPYTFELAAVAMALSTLLALPLGILSAVRRNTTVDRVAMVLALLGQSVPGFWLGLVLILVFSVHFRWLPSSGSGSVWHLVLPAVTLASFTTGRIARLVRASMLEVLGSDAMRTARAKGLSATTVVLKHALRNAAVPIVTVLGLDASALLGGAVITETVFAWPGLGRLVIQAVQQRDFPLMQAAVFFIALIVVTANFLVDLSYAFLDPRVELA